MTTKLYSAGKALTLLFAILPLYDVSAADKEVHRKSVVQTQLF